MELKGESVRNARTTKGMSQAELAKDICTSSMISQIESDKARPSVELGQKIADALGVPVAALTDNKE